MEPYLRRRRIGALVVALVVLTLVIVGCVSQPTMMGVAQAQPPKLGAEASLQPTVEAAQVEQYLQAVQAQQTLAAIAAQQTAVAMVGFQHATATAQAREQISWSATATAEAVHATATAEARREAAYAEAVRATATAEADRALLAQQLTITAEAWQMESTATAVAVHATATAEAARARREALAAKEAELTYPLRAYGPWVGLLIGLVMTIYGMLRFVKIKEARWGAIPRDPNGDAPIVILPTRDGGRTVIDPDLFLGPAIVVKQEVSRPQLGPDDHLLRVAQADKAVEALTRPVLAEGHYNAEAAKAQAKAMGKLARRASGLGRNRDFSQAAQLLRALRGASPRSLSSVPRRPSPAQRREQALRTARDLMQGRGPYAPPSPSTPVPSPYRIVPPRGAPRRWLDEVEARALERQQEEENDE